MQKKYAYILLALLVLGGFSIMEKNAFAYNLGSLNNLPAGYYKSDHTEVAQYVKVFCTLEQFQADSNDWSIRFSDASSPEFRTVASSTLNNIQFTCGTQDNLVIASDVLNTYYWVSYSTSTHEVVSNGNPATAFTTHFNSITVSTSTQKLTLTGYWQASSTILVQQSTENEILPLNIYPQSFGGSGFTNSSSTGTFNLDFKIFQTGCLSNTSSTTICTTDKTYTYQAFLYDGHYPNQQYPIRDATSTTLVNPYSASSTIFTGDFTNQFYNATVGTSSLLSETNFLSFLNVPSLLQTRVPFAYIFQIANGIYAGINSSSTGEIPSGNFVWHNTQNGTTTFDFFSRNTIQTYLSPSLISLWRAFLLVVLTIEFGYALYKRTIAHKII